MLKVAAIIPTRGDCDVSLIVRQLQRCPEFSEIRFVIGDTPFNRYQAMLESTAEVIFTQDDDCWIDPRPLIDAYDPEVITNAMTPEHAAQYQGAQTLIGFGAIFHRKLVEKAFGYPWTRDSLFYRESDRIFPTVSPHRTLILPVTILPQAHADNRLWKQPDHVSARREMNARIFGMTGIAA